MRAAILVEQHQPLVLGDVQIPSKLSYGQVHVRLAYSGLCGSQIGEIDGVKGPDQWLPHLLGHEGSGVVIGVGPGVRRTKVGDHVVLHWMTGDGAESMTPKYTWEGGRLNAGFVTTFNEEAIVSENRVTVLPPDFDLELAPLLGCALTTGFGVVTNDARLRIGESIVIFGAGGVGLSVVQAAALAGAYPVVAVDLHDNRLTLARQLGATHTINNGGDDPEPQLREILGDDLADITVDNTGNISIIELAYRIAGAHGRAILVGVPPHGHAARLHTLPLHFGKVVTGSHGGSARPSTDIPRYVALARAGKLELGPLITDRYPLDSINTAIEDLRAGRAIGRCLIQIDPTLNRRESV